MAAIAIPPSRQWNWWEERPPAPCPPAHRPPRPRPAGSRPGPAAYRRRRLAALAVLCAVVAVTVVGLQALLGRFGGGPLTTTGRPGAAAPVLRPASVDVHVVQPGETLGSIARSLSRGADPRPIVDRLVAQRHGRPLQVGERILLP